ncbi:MAG: hypothetical protein HY537_08810 [Deltaproteobacteria bacterium]|nr:hypothetical protein [Deltaproteobacteria bacterium]
MLAAKNVNAVVKAFLDAFEDKLPLLQPLSIGEPQRVRTQGVHGEIVLGALLLGDTEGKITFVWTWEGAFRFIEQLTQTKVDTYSESTQKILEELLASALQRLVVNFGQEGKKLQPYVLPTSVDASVLVSVRHDASAVKIPLLSAIGSVELILSMESAN